MTDSFRDLLLETIRREKTLLQRASLYRQALSGFGCEPKLLEIVRLVRAEQEQQPFANMQRDFHDLARRNRMRVRADFNDEPCPDCGGFHDVCSAEISGMIASLVKGLLT